MIIFQITLTGPMLRTLAMIKAANARGVSVVEMPSTAHDGRFVTTTHSLKAQGLILHHWPSQDSHSTLPEAERANLPRWSYEITPKGDAALQLAAFDMQDFLDEVKASAGMLAEPVL